MTVTTDLQTITGMLRRLHLQRWTDHGILDHVVVKLPAPVFDCVVREAKRELSFSQATLHAFDPREPGDHFKFDGIRFERIDGVYWSVKAADAPR